MIRQIAALFIFLISTPVLALPKFHPGIACVLSATNANVATASYKVTAVRTNPATPLPETVSVRVEHIGDEFKIRIEPHYEMPDYTPHILEYRVPEKQPELSGSGVQQPTFRLVESRFKLGIYNETRVTDGNLENWEPEELGNVFDYQVNMTSPFHVESVTINVSDKNGKLVERSSWIFGQEQTLN